MLSANDLEVGKHMHDLNEETHIGALGQAAEWGFDHVYHNFNDLFNVAEGLLGPILLDVFIKAFLILKIFHLIGGKRESHIWGLSGK